MKTILRLAAMNLRSLPARWSASLVLVISLAGVVGVMVSVLAMAAGFQKVFADSARPDRVVILRSGARSENESQITRDEADTLVALPGLALLPGGGPLASAELYYGSALSRKGSGEEGGVTIRGVGPQAFAVRPEVKIIAGRLFTPGLREVIVGAAAQRGFAGLELGGTVALSNVAWTVVGVFETGGDLHETEIWTDLATAQSAFQRENVNTITARLASIAAFAAYKDAVTTNPALDHEVLHERDFYALQTETTSGVIRVFGYTIAGIMALGALFSAVNTLFSAVRARQVEIATLRALGFGAAPVLCSVLIEALVLALFGASLGGLAAYLLFDGFSASTIGGDFSSDVMFQFRVTPRLLLQGVLWATAVGLLGGVPPAVRAARLPVADALCAHK
ncbi:MAG: ABC transporter permease [Nevskia sp.]|nr:ABC transporter permease [Nevskia sp.]